MSNNPHEQNRARRPNVGGVYGVNYGKSNIANAICDLCRLRGANADMIEDHDRPGLFVHPECADTKDPWKLPPRQTENISLKRVRKDPSTAFYPTDVIVPDDD